MEFEGVCHRAEAILNGVFSTDPDLMPGSGPWSEQPNKRSNIRELSKLFFEALQFVNSEVQDTIDYHLSEEEFKGKISKWDERTSTSPGTNMHLGHLKAYWARHSLVERKRRRKGTGVCKTVHTGGTPDSAQLCSEIRILFRLMENGGQHHAGKGTGKPKKSID